MLGMLHLVCFVVILGVSIMLVSLYYVVYCWLVVSMVSSPLSCVSPLHLTYVVKFGHPCHISRLASNHHGLLIIPIHWLALSLSLLSTSKLVCGYHNMAFRWMLHIGGGWDSPLLWKALWVPRKALYKSNELLLFKKVTLSMLIHATPS